MSKKLTTEEFIERAQNIHKDENGNPKYDYSLVKYVSSNSKVEIICKKNEHGIFAQSPSNHLSDKGCPKCIGRNKTTEEFIEEAKKVIQHKDKNYNYSKTVYTNAKTKVIIICLKEGHGEFLQTPNNHLRGVGCGMCGKSIKLTTKEFTKRAKNVEKHKDKNYDYSLVEYINCDTKIIIICQKEGHGEFLQTPDNHMHGQGCPICGGTKQLTQEEFIERSQKIHKNKEGAPLYDYSKSIYVKHYVKLIIICKKHGEFTQTPNAHYCGCGCPKCNSSKGEIKIINFLEKNNFKYNHQYKFNGCKNKQKLPFDFYLLNYNICIEYDGKQHFEPVQFKGSSLEDALIRFEITKINDQIKTDYCLNNNIKLIRIPYWDFKSIEAILEKELNIAYVKN